MTESAVAPTKTLVVSYNKIEGIPAGRHEIGSVIVHSGDYLGYRTFEDVAKMSNTEVDALIQKAKGTVVKLERAHQADLACIGCAYVYVGMLAMNEAIGLIKRLQLAGKTVTAVACSCELRAKESAMAELNVTMITSECGGDETLAEIIRNILHAN